MRSYFFLLIFLFVVTGLLLIDPEATAGMTKETGVVEIGTTALYVVLIALLLFFAQPRWPVGKYWYALVAGVLLCRELDFDKIFTSQGILKSRFYESPDVPIMEKVWAILILLVILGAVVFTFVKSRKSLFEGIRRRDPIQLGVVVAFCLAAVSKLVLDGLPRKLEKIGLGINDYVDAHHGKFEEVLEMGIPIALIIALVYSRKDFWVARSSAEQSNVENILRS